MNTLAEMKIEYEAAKEDQKNSKTRTARLGINDALYKLKKKIDVEENRITQSLEVLRVDGKLYTRPYSMNWSKFDKYTLKVEGNVLYVIDKTGELSKDDSYNWYHYVWIPQTEIKYAKLTVHTLGKDIYGDRYYLEVDYYKHPADTYSYMTKRLDPHNRTYKPHALYILKELGLLKNHIE